MGYRKCLGCGYTTGDTSTHRECAKSGTAIEWEACDCGSGGHPRKCALHPSEYDRHCAELSIEYQMDELRAERDAAVARAERAEADRLEAMACNDENAIQVSELAEMKALRAVADATREYRADNLDGPKGRAVDAALTKLDAVRGKEGG